MDQQQAAANEPVVRAEDADPGEHKGILTSSRLRRKTTSCGIICHIGSPIHLQLSYRRLVLPRATWLRSGTVGGWEGGSGEA